MDIVFDLLKPPSLDEAQALTTALQQLPGMVSAIVAPERKQIYVTYEASRLTEMQIRQTLKDHHVVISTMEHPASINNEEVEYTRGTNRGH